MTQNEYERGAYGKQVHIIKSDQILVCADTGRVIAVFYNDCDLDSILEDLGKVQKLQAQVDALEDLLTECTNDGELDGRLLNSYMEFAINMSTRR